jgi:hypothetical protein
MAIIFMVMNLQKVIKSLTTDTQVSFEPGVLRNEAVIFIRFPYQAMLNDSVRQLIGVRWFKG